MSEFNVIKHIVKRIFKGNVISPPPPGISWSIKETASASSTPEGNDLGLQKSSSSTASFPKQASSYSLSSFFKGKLFLYRCSRIEHQEDEFWGQFNKDNSTSLKFSVIATVFYYSIHKSYLDKYA